MSRIFYLWDFADTLFPERWDEAKSGAKSYDGYLRLLGKDPGKISAREYEEAYQIPMRTGLLNVSLADGFREVLSWTKNNAAFTTGVREQLAWRCDQFQKKYGFDVSKYLPEIFSTFDYGNTNKKTMEMYSDILQKLRTRGYNMVAYADNDLKNCQMFLEAARGQPYRLYHMLGDRKGLRNKDGYWEIGSLKDLLINEQNIRGKTHQKG